MKPQKLPALFLAMCVFFAIGCEDKESKPYIPKSSILIEGEVSRGFYSSFGVGMGSASSVEYAISLKITNNTAETIVYTMAQGAFVPCQGTPLVSNTYAYKDSDELDSYGKGNDKMMLLSPFSSEDFDFSTNGYTGDLLRDAGRLPLQFIFTLFYNGRAVVEPFRANLPDIGDLVSSYSSGQKQKLSFFR